MSFLALGGDWDVGPQESTAATNIRGVARASESMWVGTVRPLVEAYHLLACTGKRHEVPIRDQG